ncbi:hypothetical protein COV49_00435 [Candidatus Falkowbacteria bacterium CG11_big_fil_rev_8_21_14_0_20_39_10]|uniref:Uncharacterized protein n=1 Tax=Candidatus Falkowbacteria bacterium CG11_big_fil_rev_8_21_14_0_20_39_10 TaxID=1974570 RepID=A0A2M6KA32_9BACT|nr:MAG: hypothetical protein COV49_00435 [Candidatus Falkowbacteria bacterium CG11_big_fil_rev_8_21_14_0_20_39_10]
MDKLSKIIKDKKIDPSAGLGSQTKKPPAYEWQDLALRIIDELNIPGFKRNAVFKVCKEKPKQVILLAMNDTKELCQTGERWKYFFKVLAEK